MYVELQQKAVIVRKPHRCEWCAERIEKGEDAHYRSYVWDDGLQSGWMHPECWAAMSEEDYRNLEDGWMPGDYKRGTCECV